MKRILLGLLLSACSPSSSSTPAAPAVDVSGNWQSTCQQSSQLSFAIAPKTWTLDYDVFSDAACTAKLLTVHVEGPYEIGAASSVVPGAHEARFGFTKKTVTAHSAAAAAYAGVPEGTTDISTSGAAKLGQRPIATCAQDYDLVKREGDTLQFGARPQDNDMCTPDKRPTALSPVVLSRRSP